MKEYVLCEFLIEASNMEHFKILHDLDPDFIITDINSEFEIDENDNSSTWTRISGKINSEFATMLKLRHADLAERMRISYIPDELKDKYRTGNR